MCPYMHFFKYINVQILRHHDLINMSDEKSEICHGEFGNAFPTLQQRNDTN